MDIPRVTFSLAVWSPIKWHDATYNNATLGGETRRNGLTIEQLQFCSCCCCLEVYTYTNKQKNRACESPEGRRSMWIANIYHNASIGGAMAAGSGMPTHERGWPLSKYKGRCIFDLSIGTSGKYPTTGHVELHRSAHAAERRDESTRPTERTARQLIYFAVPVAVGVDELGTGGRTAGGFLLLILRLCMVRPTRLLQEPEALSPTRMTLKMWSPSCVLDTEYKRQISDI